MLEPSMFYGGASDLLRIGVVGSIAYIALVALLRLTGKRTLSKLNMFDLVVTIALGSTLATVLLSKDVALSEGILAFILLIALQYAVTFTSVRSRLFDSFIKAEPTLLFHDGRFLDTAMKFERITQDEIRPAIRQQGLEGPAAGGSVVLETDGSLIVIRL
jgi:uncharacterized membrane protein YcaP (DUF421 family)